MFQAPVRSGTESLETLEKKIFCSCSGKKLMRTRSGDMIDLDITSLDQRGTAAWERETKG